MNENTESLNDLNKYSLQKMRMVVQSTKDYRLISSLAENHSRCQSIAIPQTNLAEFRRSCGMSVPAHAQESYKCSDMHVLENANSVFVRSSHGVPQFKLLFNQRFQNSVWYFNFENYEWRSNQKPRPVFLRMRSQNADISAANEYLPSSRFRAVSKASLSAFWKSES